MTLVVVVVGVAAGLVGVRGNIGTGSGVKRGRLLGVLVVVFIVVGGVSEEAGLVGVGWSGE